MIFYYFSIFIIYILEKAANFCSMQNDAIGEEEILVFGLASF